MPTEPIADPNELERWFQDNLVPLLVLAVVLIVVYVFSSRLLNAAITRALAAQARDADLETLTTRELAKRADTMHGLARAVLRLAIVFTFVIIVIGLLDLWGLVAGIGLAVAALTLAGQPIVLDYLMGILIVLEGQYFNGDWIRVGAVEGEVEAVGLRRTVVRDTTGSVHSISNREVSVVSNDTRVYATAEVELPGVREEDLARVIELMDEVGREIATDPAWADRIIAAPAYALVSDLTDLGVTAKMRGRVHSADRWVIAGEIRRRLVAACVAADIDFNRRGIEPRIRRSPPPEPAGG